MLIEPKLRQLKPTLIQQDITRIEPKMLHRMLLIEIIENLRRGPNIIHQLAAHDAGLLELLALDQAVAQVSSTAGP